MCVRASQPLQAGIYLDADDNALVLQNLGKFDAAGPSAEALRVLVQRLVKHDDARYVLTQAGSCV